MKIKYFKKRQILKKRLEELIKETEKIEKQKALNDKKFDYYFMQSQNIFKKRDALKISNLYLNEKFKKIKKEAQEIIIELENYKSYIKIELKNIKPIKK